MPTMNRLPHALLLTSLIGLCATSEVWAQATSTSTEGFGDLAVGRTIIVVDDSGAKTTGRLLLFTPDTLKMALNGQEVVFERKNVAVVFERRNSVKKGLIAGALSGPALGLAAILTGEDDGMIAFGVVVFSAIGVAVGTAIDAMIPEKRLVYANNSAFESGDSNRNGMVIGLFAGATAGFTAGAFKDDCYHPPTVEPSYPSPLDCYAGEKIVHGLKVAALTGLAGAGLGVVIDRLIVGQRLIHGTRTGRGPVTISTNPSLSQARLGLSTSVSW